MNQIEIKHFTALDRRTSLADTLTDANGTVINLTGHTVALLLVRASDDVVLLDEVAATVDSAADGNVSYAWGASEPPAPASGSDATECWYWWVVTRTSDGKKEHFPGDGEKRKLWIHRAR